MNYTDVFLTPGFRHVTCPELVMVAPACDCRLRFAQRPSRDPPLVGDAETRHQPRGAGEGNRTLDLLITNQLLCRLSYASVEPKAYFAKTSA